jgi:hypothetical protein
MKRFVLIDFLPNAFLSFCFCLKPFQTKQVRVKFFGHHSRDINIYLRTRLNNDTSRSSRGVVRVSKKRADRLLKHHLARCFHLITRRVYLRKICIAQLLSSFLPTRPGHLRIHQHFCGQKAAQASFFGICGPDLILFDVQNDVKQGIKFS